MKRKLNWLIAAVLMVLVCSCSGMRSHMYGGVDSHDGPYYGAGWNYDSYDGHHHKHHKHKKHKKHKKHHKYKKHQKKHHHHHHDHDD